MSNEGITYTVSEAIRSYSREHAEKACFSAIRLHPESRISPDANLIGKITIGKDASVFAGALLRGDYETITIGEQTTIEDGVVIHGGLGHAVTIGEHTTIGHHCMIHGCTIGDNTLVGMNSCIMNGAVVGNNCLIGAGSLITQDTVIPDRWMAFGTPARLIRELNDEEIESLITVGAESYKYLSMKMEREGLLKTPDKLDL